MRDLKLILFSVLCLFGCQSPEHPAYDYPEAVEASLEIIEVVTLGEQDIYDPSLAHLSYRKFGDYHGFWSKSGEILIYDRNGDLYFRYSRTDLSEDFRVPDYPVGFDFNPVTKRLYMLFAEKKEIYVVDDRNELIETITVAIPEDQWLTMSPDFFIDWTNSKILIGLGNLDAVGDANEFFVKSALISVFEMDGTFVQNIGSYPQAYHDSGKFTHGHPYKHHHAALTSNGLFFAFDIYPDIYSFDVNGVARDTVKAATKKRSYSFKKSGIPHYEDGLMPWQTNDVNYFISIDYESDLYYYGVQRRLEKWQNSDTYLIKYDQAENKMYEVNLYKDLFKYAKANPRLAWESKGDTLEFFLASAFEQHAKVVYAMIKEN